MSAPPMLAARGAAPAAGSGRRGARAGRLASTLARESRTAARIAAALLALAAVAAVVAAAMPEVARGWLGFGFAGIERRPSEALSILANNLRVLAAVLIACGAVQLADRSPATPGFARALVALCDAGLAVAAACHAIVIGLGVGAYGGRMVAALLPHGPFELVAYSLALALYGAARRERVGADRWLAAGGASALCLAIGAPLEVFAAL